MERFRGKRPEAPPKSMHPARLEKVAVVLDYIRGGYYMDPHKHHRNQPVAQAIGYDKFTLLDGIPISGDVEFLDKVTVTMELLKHVYYPIEERGRPVQKRSDVILSCIYSKFHKRIYCYPITPITDREYELLPLSFDDPNIVTIIRDYRDFEELLERLGFPRKILAAPNTTISYDDLTVTAKNNLVEAVKYIIREREEFFVEFFNVAQPINVRLHAIELLKGIGKKVLKRILMERERKPFRKFDEVKQILKRDPVEALAEKVLEELRGEAKYYLFVRPKTPTAPFLDYLTIMRRAYNARIRTSEGSTPRV